MAVLLFFLTAFTLITVVASSNSILDMINKEEVERLIAWRKINSSRNFALEQNLLEEDENYFPDHLSRKNISEEMQDIFTRHGEKLLRSSKDALLITKKEYLRKDWCKTEPLVQIVKEEGCAQTSVLNRFCYGQCNSFYIPKSPKSKVKSAKSVPDQTAFKSCAFCRPKRSSWVTVTLRCHKKKRTVLRRKKILRVKECKCMAEPSN